MQYTPEQIKDKLLKALDNDYNIVDMAAVVEVITTLEAYPITIQALESTRLGRYVNDLRKKTPDEDLAKRIKKLVRSWQKLISPEAGGGGGGGGINGSDRLSQLQLGGSRNTSPALSNSPALRAAGLPTRPITPSGYSRPVTPAGVRPLTPASARPLTPSNRSLAPASGRQVTPSGGRQVTPSGRPLTPSSGRPLTPSSGNGRVVAPGSNARPITPSSARNQLTVPGARTTNSISPLAAGQNQSSYKQGSYAKSQVSPAASKPIYSTPVSSKSANNNNTVQAQSKTNAANRKRIRGDSFGEPSAAKKPALHSDMNTHGDLANGLDANNKAEGLKRTTSQTSLVSSVSNQSNNRNRAVNSAKKKPPSDSGKPVVSKTPKVKTTAQILAEMQAKNRSDSLKSDTVAQITSNRIAKEQDTIHQSIVPASAKPRPRKKPGGAVVPPSTPDPMSRKELVENYLNSCYVDANHAYRSESPVVAESPPSPASFKASHHTAFPPSNNGSGPVDRKPPDSVKDLKPAVKKKPIAEELAEIYSRLPPLDLDAIKWDSDDDVDEATGADKMDDSEVDGLKSCAPKVEVSEELVDKLNNEQWTGFNGCRDNNGDWRDWTTTFSLGSYNGDLLHVLPYVDLDG